jgi:hypothetical protein
MTAALGAGICGLTILQFVIGSSVAFFRLLAHPFNGGQKPPQKTSIN